jgi:hypothetical protein
MSCCHKISNGFTGLAKAAIGNDRAPSDKVKSRRTICLKCPQAVVFSEVLPIRCKSCGCILMAKTRIAGEKCPEGKW